MTLLLPGYQLDYAQVTANVNVTHTEATGPDTILTGNPITYDGATLVKVEFYCQVIEIPTNGYDFNLGLYEGTSLVKLLIGLYDSNAGILDVSGYGLCFLTPTAGSHTYAVKAYKSPGSSGTAIVAAGDGVGDNFPPAFYRITQA